MVASSRWFVALTLGLAAHAAPAHAAGWTEPVTLPGAQEQITDRGTLLRFDAAGRGVAEWSNGGAASISRTSDSAASWTTGVMPQFVPETIAVAFDGAGNRVYAYVASSNLRIVRTGCGGKVGIVWRVSRPGPGLATALRPQAAAPRRSLRRYGRRHRPDGGRCGRLATGRWPPRRPH